MNLAMIAPFVEQMKREGEASSVYASLAQWARLNGLPGISEWFAKASVEETEHQKKFMDFVVDYYDKPVPIPGRIEAFLQPTSALDAFNAARELEGEVTNFIEELARKAEQVEDQVARNFLEWFLEEQNKSGCVS